MPQEKVGPATSSFSDVGDTGRVETPAREVTIKEDTMTYVSNQVGWVSRLDWPPVESSSSPPVAGMQNAPFGGSFVRPKLFSAPGPGDPNFSSFTSENRIKLWKEFGDRQRMSAAEKLEELGVIPAESVPDPVLPVQANEEHVEMIVLIAIISLLGP